MENKFQMPHEMGINEIYREMDTLNTEIILKVSRLAILRSELEKRHGKPTSQE